MKTFGRILFIGSSLMLWGMQTWSFYNWWGISGVLLGLFLPPLAELYPFIYLFLVGFNTVFLVIIAVWGIGILGMFLGWREKQDDLTETTDDRNNPTSNKSRTGILGRGISLVGTVILLLLGLAISTGLAIFLMNVLAGPSVQQNKQNANGTQSQPQVRSSLDLTKTPTPDYLKTITYLESRATHEALSSVSNNLPTSTVAAKIVQSTRTQSLPPTTKVQPSKAPDAQLKHDLYVCTPFAEMRKGKGAESEIAGIWPGNEIVEYWSKEGEWLYLGRDENGIDYYMNQKFVCPASQRPPPTPNICIGYQLPETEFILRYNSSMKPIRGITRPNGIKVYYDISNAEYWGEGQRNGSQGFNCPAEAEANGFADGKP